MTKQKLARKSKTANILLFKTKQWAGEIPAFITMENPHTKERQKQLRIKIKELQKQGAKIIEVHVCLFTSSITITFEYENKIHSVKLNEFAIDIKETIKKIN